MTNIIGDNNSFQQAQRWFTRTLT